MEFQGKNIREVWDFRLSSAVPVINRTSGTWVVEIWSKDNPDYDPKRPESAATPLEAYDTGIEAVEGDEFDSQKVGVCYQWLYTVRDKYALPNIEELKPHVAKINEANEALSKLGAA